MDSCKLLPTVGVMLCVGGREEYVVFDSGVGAMGELWELCRA